MENNSLNENLLEIDITWFDILALDARLKERLHLKTEEIELTQEDIELINTALYIDLEKLGQEVEKCGFSNSAIEEEMGISRSHYSMVFGNSNRKNKRGIRMRLIVAILNAIRRRKVTDDFEEIGIFVTKK